MTTAPPLTPPDTRTPPPAPHDRATGTPDAGQPVLRADTALRRGSEVTAEPGEAVRLDLYGRPVVRLRGLGPAAVDVLRLMAHGRRIPPDLQPAIHDQVGAALARIPHLLAQAVWHGDRQLVVAERVASMGPFELPVLAPRDRLRLSRFAVTRRVGTDLVVESPLTSARIVIVDPAVAVVLAALACPTAVTSLVAGSAPLAEEAVLSVLGLLVGAGVVELGVPGAAEASAGDDAGSPAAFTSDTDEVLRQWEPVDLLFHATSRMGRTDAPFGGRFPFVGRIDPQPAVRALPAGPRIALPVPDLETIRERDPRLVDVQEARSSVRRYGSRPMTLEQLGELLFRAARVRSTYGPRPDAGMPYQASSRPYPCGGAGYELEIYLVVRRCAGLETGAYYYAPAQHTLVRLPTSPEHQERLLATASLSAGGHVEPDVLVSITSRFQRLSWKYQAIAYAVTLKHVGVLYQTLYLVATAMGLAPCGLGSGNSEDAAQAFGLDYLCESSVGEFLLGSSPDAPPHAGQVAAPQWDDWVPGQGADWQGRAQSEVLARTGRGWS